MSVRVSVCMSVVVKTFLVLQCCPGYVDTDLASHKGWKTIDEGMMLRINSVLKLSHWLLWKFQMGKVSVLSRRIEAFNSTSRYLDDLLNIDNPYFKGMVNQIYPPELQLNKANISDTEAPFLDLHLLFLFIYLFIQYFERVTLLAISQSTKWPSINN